MANINKNIIMQAGAAVANAANKAAGLSAATPEPGSIISAIQLVNGGRAIGPAALAHFTESVRNKLLSLLVSMEPIQSGSGIPSPDNVRPINGRTGLHIYVSPTPYAADANTYAFDWTSEAGTVYGGTLDVVSGLLTVTHKHLLLNDTDWTWKAGVFGVWKRYYTQETVQDARNNQSCLTSIFPMVDNITNNFGIAIDTATSAKQIDVRTLSGIGFDTLSDFKTYIHDNPIDAVYELATPLTYQLTGIDIVTLVGDNYIWSDSGDVTITE